MSYIGQGLPADTFQGFTTDKFTGDGTANKAFTLTKEPFSEDTILVTIDGVVQEPTDDFTVSGTTLTLVGTAANGSEVNVTHMGGPLPIGGAAELDLNGASDKLVLDADADTTISADTDDQIDVKIGGTDALRVTGTALTGNALATIGAAGTASTVAGIPFYLGDSSSIYTHDVSGTDDTAESNAAYGISALDAITTGDSNVAIGAQAGTDMNTGNKNVMIGKNAFANATSAAENVIIGFLAGGAQDATSGYNVVIGNEAAEEMTSMSESTVVGYKAATSNTTGSHVIAIGYEAYDGADTENHNLAIGTAALGGSVAGGEYNVAIGNYALDALTSADYNVAVGYNCMTNLTTGGYNHAIGRFAGDAVTDETFSIYMGYNAGDDYTGSQSIMIGSYTRHASSGNDEANAICIGHSVNTGRGNQIHLGNTSMTAIKGQVSFSTYSDERIKRDIVDGDLGLEFIEKLKPRKFKRKDPEEYADLFEEMNKTPIKDEEKELVFDGLIAQEVEQTCKELGVTFSGHEISQNTGNKQSIQYETLVVPLIKAVQELSAKVKELESK